MDMDAELRLDHSLVALEKDGGVFGLLELRAPEPAADASRPTRAGRSWRLHWLSTARAQ